MRVHIVFCCAHKHASAHPQLEELPQLLELLGLRRGLLWRLAGPGRRRQLLPGPRQLAAGLGLGLRLVLALLPPTTAESALKSSKHSR